MNANLPSVMCLPKVPGIDDCDVLFTISSRDGRTTLYLRLQEFVFDHNTWYVGAITFDCDKSHNCMDLETKLKFRTLSVAAYHLRETAREVLGLHNYVYCNNLRKFIK